MVSDVKKQVKQIDLYNPQFDHYFIDKLNNITPEERALLPERLSFKIYKFGIEGSSERLTFQEKMWILSVVFKQSVTIMVEDRKNGIGMREYGKARAANRGKINNGELLDEMQVHSAFVIGDRELMAASLYMDHVCCSNIFSLVKEIIKNTGHKKNQQFIKSKKDVNEILKFLTNYEAKKRRIALDYGMTMPKWYALLYFSTGEKLGADFYNRDFQYAYASNRITLHRDMKWLQENGYLMRRGEKLKYRYSVTGAGLNLLNRIMDNIILKY